MAELKFKEYKCRTCEKKFSGPKTSNYVCAEKSDGNHDVDQKTYYCDSKGLLINWKKEKKVADPNGGYLMLEAGRDIIFSNGTFTTSDPAEQDYMDRYKGAISYEQWEKIHVPLKERTEKAQRENESFKGQLEAQNAELAELRAKLGTAAA